MRETRLSGSVEGVVSNHDPYSDSCGLNRDDGKRKSGSESATEKQQRSFQLSAVVGGKGLWVAAWKKAADFCRYSYLRATIGSTRIARRAGIYVARKATTTNPSDAMPNVAASVGRSEEHTSELQSRLHLV